MDEKRFIFGWLPVLALWFFVLATVLSFLGGASYVVYIRWIRTEQIAAETTAVRASLPYVDGANQMLLAWIDDYNDLETEKAKAGSDAMLVGALTLQQGTDLDRICEKARLLRDEQLVGSVQHFLDSHPCVAR